MDSRTKRALSAEQSELLRSLPSVDELLLQPRLRALASRVDRDVLLEVTRSALAALRESITGAPEPAALTLAPDAIAAHISDSVERILTLSLQPVINATGVILHTNLGRAPMLSAAADHIRHSAAHYSNLEYDLEAGQRGKRDAHTSRLFERLTGAGAAIVVNNCAAAVLLSLAALAKGGEVLVSRGELIEIGDGFRIPEVMAESGALLREVGTTNRTRIEDYERAITEKTRLLLRVHPSNFHISGFTERPSLAELAELGRRTGLPVMEDLGSGCLVDLSASGVSEPVVRQSFEAGADIVAFSGDKLLGGPQAGIIAGKADLVAQIRRYPLYRALRVDKLTIAALQITLGAYLRGALDEIPALRMIRLSAADIGRRAEKFLAILRLQVSLAEAEIDVRAGSSLIGGGATPADSLPTMLIRVSSSRHSAAQLEKRLRRASSGVSVIARVEEDRILLDLRTVFPEQDAALAATLAAALR
jgi:L-seryl-tRNA(Ser) seleniumtransferase